MTHEPPPTHALRPACSRFRPPRRPGARDHTVETKAKACALLLTGSALHEVATICGVSRTTLRRWRAEVVAPVFGRVRETAGPRAFGPFRFVPDAQPDTFPAFACDLRVEGKALTPRGVLDELKQFERDYFASVRSGGADGSPREREQGDEGR